MPEAPSWFLREGPLKPGDAAVALIVVDGTKYLLQLRDDIPGIFYPGHWGLFGGALDAGEAPEVGLRRELFEELAFTPQVMDYFTEFTFDFAPHGREHLKRRYFETRVRQQDIGTLRLGEGADLRVFSPAELLSQNAVVPYDAMAIWMHATRTFYHEGPGSSPGSLGSI